MTILPSASRPRQTVQLSVDGLRTRSSGLIDRLTGRLDPALAGLMILAYALAAYRLDTKDLWLDEAVSANHARLPLSGLWTVISGQDPNMGLYYVLLHFWARVFGYSPSAVRSLSVLLGGLTIPAIVVLGTRLFGRSAGLLTGLLLATNPFFLHYEQDARAYALVVLLVVLSSLFFVKAIEQPSRSTRIGYVIASALSIYAHYFAAFVLLVQLLTLLLARRRAAFTRYWIGAAAAVAVLCIPEVVFAVRAGTRGISWIRVPHFYLVSDLGRQLAGGRVLAYLLAILICFGFSFEVRHGKPWRAWFLAAWLILPVLLVFVISKLGRPLFVNYFFIVVLPAITLLVAAALTRIPSRPAAVVFAVAVVVLAALGMRNWYDRPSIEAYRPATAYILAHQRPGDALLPYPEGTLEGPTSGLTYYETLGGRRGPTLIDAGSRVPLTNSRRIWLVMRNMELSPQEQVQVERELEAAYGPATTPVGFINLTVVLYRRRS